MSVKVAVLGIGNHARRNTLPALAECKSIELVGVSSRNKNITTQEAEHYQCKVYADGNEILEDDNIDAVYIALPIGLHADWGLKTLQSGKHLWCEKSLTHSPEISRQVIKEATRNALSVCECFMYIHHPQFEYLKTIMQGNQIGEVKHITARFGFPHLSPDDIRYSKVLGGGALLDAGCYPIHAVRQLTQSVPEHVHSILSSGAGFEVDTGGSVLMNFDTGLHAHVQWGFGLGYLNEIELWGEDSRIMAKRAFTKPANYESVIEILDSDGNRKTKNIPACNHFIAMFSLFANACKDANIRQIFLEDAEQQAFLMEKINNHNPGY